MEEDAVMAEMDWPKVRHRKRAAVAKLVVSTMACSGFVRESKRVGGRARAGERRDNTASSSSCQPACIAVRASRAHGVHAAATLWLRSAMTGLIRTAIKPDGAD